MTHLFICREYPPAAYLPGGIGTYVHQIARLLAQAGETVHVISHRWDGAPRVREESHDGRLIVHRVALDEPVPDESLVPLAEGNRSPFPFPLPASDRVPRGMLASSFPSQAFAWQAALLADRLIDAEAIDVIE
ncbi:MAG: glycosyl transferase group 1, partial [Acidobacteria bacterium]|nr:glycosyl transferase group 1 [Acidobacteriota bacterium]